MATLVTRFFGTSLLLSLMKTSEDLNPSLNGNLATFDFGGLAFSFFDDMLANLFPSLKFENDTLTLDLSEGEFLTDTLVDDLWMLNNFVFRSGHELTPWALDENTFTLWVKALPEDEEFHSLRKSLREFWATKDHDGLQFRFS